MDKKTNADSDEANCKGGPVDKKVRVARDRVFYNVRRRLALSGADVDTGKKGRLLR